MPLRLKPVIILKKNMGIEPNGELQAFFTDTCAKHMDKYVPFDKGILRKYVIEGSDIIYQQQYAEYQYYGERRDGSHKINPANRNRENHSEATSYWDKKMVTAEGKDVLKKVGREMEKYINRGA